MIRFENNPSPRSLTQGADAIAALQSLEQALADPVCILGVGNRDRGDDGAGSLIAQALRGQTSATVIDAGAVPENHLEQVVRSRPRTIVLIDAVDFGGAAGELRILGPQSIAHAGVSTHGLSLRMTMDYLRERTQARLALLAIQPARVTFKAGLSQEVDAAVARVCESLSCLLGESMRDTPLEESGGNGS